MKISLTICIGCCILLQIAAAQRWGFPVRKSAFIITISTVIGLCLAIFLAVYDQELLISILILLLGQNIVFVGIILLFFYRDPERKPPQDELAIVSPADGTIIYVEKREAGDILEVVKKGNRMVLEEIKSHTLAKENLWQIGISMAFTDVHINRSPIGGRVTLLNYRSGKYLSLRKAEAINVNERQTMVIENKRIGIAIVQIASRLVRRIEAYVGKDREVERGEKIGRIIFGSQVDVFIPEKLIEHIEVHKGEYIFAGESILCRMKDVAKELP